MGFMNEMNIALTEVADHSRRLQEAAERICSLCADIAAAYYPEIVARQAAAEKTVTIEEIRALLFEKRQAGFDDEARALIKRHGAKKLTEIDPGEYAALLQEAEAIGQ